MAAKTEVETKDAPGAPQDGEALTIEIPQDFEFPEGPAAEASAEPAKEAAQPAPKPEAKEAPKAEGKVVPIGALHEERQRRKGAEKESAYWRRVAADRDKLRSPQPEGKREPERKAPVPRPDPKRHLREAFGRLAPDVDKVLPEFRPIQERLVEAVAEVLDDTGRWTEARHAEIEAAHGSLIKTVDAVNGWIEDQRTLNRTKIKRQEGEIRRKHKDWEELCKKAGIFEAVAQDAQGRYADPLIALQLYSSDNVPEEAYRLAKSKLAYDAEELGEEVEEQVETPTLSVPADKAEPKDKGKAETDAPAPKGGEGEAEAERRGRAEVATAVAANADKPRGIRGLRSAGPGRGELRLNEDTRRYMDHLMEVDYDRYERLVKANGGKEGRLYRWHHGGY